MTRSDDLLSNKFRNRKSKLAKVKLPVILLPVISVALMFAFFEALLRISIFLEVPYFRNPSLYSYPFSDDFWKLDYRWRNIPDGAGDSGENLNPDPLLGWSPPKTPENPLGLVGHPSYKPDFQAKAILFYGDSFVASKTAPEDSIPRQLDKLLPNNTVYNYGVSNYAVDQIYLRFKETHSAFQSPMVIVGVLTLDLDRTVLTVRSRAPKPYFTVGDNGQLVLHGIQDVPINKSPTDWIDAWHQQNPPKIPSYLAAFIAQKIDNIQTGGDWLASTRAQANIEQLNGLVIEEIVSEARTHHLPLLFVIFYTRGELDRTYWRELFLIEQFERLGVPYLDTKVVLLYEARRHSKDLSDYYFADGGHLNELGNKRVAGAIAEIFNKNLVVDSGQR